MKPDDGSTLASVLLLTVIIAPSVKFVLLLNYLPWQATDA